MDDYEADLRLDDHSDTDVWAGEDEITISGMPKALWCDDDTSKRPAEPEQWVDQLANQVELQRLCSMGVLASLQLKGSPPSWCMIGGSKAAWMRKDWRESAG